MASANGTIVSQNYYNGGWLGYKTNTAAYAGATPSKFFPYILQFKTPSFSGVSQKVTFTFKAYRPTGTSYTSVGLRYALATSDANKGSYLNTSLTVSDSYQITTGTTTFSSLTSSSKSFTFSINTSALKSNTTYYLYMWCNYDAGYQYIELEKSSSHSVSVDYTNGLVNVYNGGWGKYAVYIHNGTKWEQYIPYIYDGGWKVCT